MLFRHYSSDSFDPFDPEEFLPWLVEKIIGSALGGIVIGVIGALTVLVFPDHICAPKAQILAPEVSSTYR